MSLTKPLHHELERLENVREILPLSLEAHRDTLEAVHIECIARKQSCGGVHVGAHSGLQAEKGVKYGR